MAGVPAHTHVVVSGSVGASERFAFGWDLHTVGGSQVFAQSIADAVASIFTTAGINKTTFTNLLRANSAYTKVTVYDYAEGSNTARLVASTPMNVPGTGAGSNCFQMAIVASFTTDVPSRRTRGRCYLPAQAAAIDLEGRVVTPPVLEIAGAIATAMLASGIDYFPVVISRAGDLETEIKQVRVDNKPDTQRRRAYSVQPNAIGVAAL